MSGKFVSEQSTPVEAVPEREAVARQPATAAGFLTPAAVLALQRRAGNRAVRRALAAQRAPERGLRLHPDDTEPVRGRSVGEWISDTAGDIARPVAWAAGSVVGAAMGAITGVTVSSHTNTGPRWDPGGAAEWHINFTTSGRSGWLVQKVENSWRAKDAAGNAVASPFTPKYYEAWAVDAAGNVTPDDGAGNNDQWDNPDFNAQLSAIEGHWATSAKVYFTTVDPATHGFIANNPATNAGILLSSTTAPAALDLGIARLHRYAQGTWDSTGATATHTGSAR